MRATAQVRSKPVAAAAGGCETAGWRGTVRSEMQRKTGGIEQQIWRGNRAKGRGSGNSGTGALDALTRLRVEQHNRVY